MYIFTYWFRLPLKDAAGFLTSLVASSNFISNPEYINSTHHLVTNLDPSTCNASVLPLRRPKATAYCHSYDT